MGVSRYLTYGKLNWTFMTRYIRDNVSKLYVCLLFTLAVNSFNFIMDKINSAS